MENKKFNPVIYLTKNENVIVKKFKSTTGKLINIVNSSGRENFYRITLEIKKDLKSLPLKGKTKARKIKFRFKTKLIHRIFAVSEEDLPAETMKDYLNETITVAPDSIEIMRGPSKKAA